MKAKQSILASVALAAMAVAAFGKHRQNVSKCEQQNDEKCHKEALDTFEGEGGLVLA
jgi:hypothetical protein